VKVTIKTKDMNFKIPIYVPLSLCTFFLNRYGKNLTKYGESVNSYLDSIDPVALSEGLEILKDYKGLKIVIFQM
jgi:hypothetical protein